MFKHSFTQVRWALSPNQQCQRYWTVWHVVTKNGLKTTKIEHKTIPSYPASRHRRRSSEPAVSANQIPWQAVWWKFRLGTGWVWKPWVTTVISPCASDVAEPLLTPGDQSTLSRPGSSCLCICSLKPNDNKPFTYGSYLGMWRSQPISASVGCGFHVQNPSDSDADLLRDQNYQLF